MAASARVGLLICFVGIVMEGEGCICGGQERDGEGLILTSTGDDGRSEAERLI